MEVSRPDFMGLGLVSDSSLKGLGFRFRVGKYLTRKYWVSVPVSASDFKGLGLGRVVSVSNGQVLVSVSVDEVSVSDDEAKTPSLVVDIEKKRLKHVNINTHREQT